MMPPALALAVVCCLAAAARPLVAQRDGAGGARFRAGLTATVDGGAGAKGCRQVTLRWPLRDGAVSYQVRVAAMHDGAWTSPPSTSTCGAAHPLSLTAVIDAEPIAPATTRRLFYRVIALGPTGPVDSTDVVPVELLAAAPARPGRP